MTGPGIESMIVEALPDGDRALLRRGAVLRYITRDLAEVVTDSAQAARQLVEHPVLQGGDRGRAEGLWTISEPLRRALVSGWSDADAVRAKVADEAGGLEARYARLAAAGTRADALAELQSAFTAALAGGDVPAAHDLLRLLEEWPVADDPAATDLGRRLAPALRRHSRALPDREATEHYLRRGFEDALWALMFGGDSGGGADDRWMLQLHAPGGRGKTMFVKNLLGRRCPERDIPVARIDFDYVARLGIATTEPWRLLLSVAAQLDPQLPNAPFRFLLESYGELQDVVRPEALPRVRPGTATVDPKQVVDQAAVDAARDVPTKFRAELATALGDRPVVVALDTVENVLHTDGADLAPVLAAFGELVHGAEPDRVPGLRLIVSGRFDLAEDRPVPAGSVPQPRSPGFREAWVGPDVEVRDLGGTPARLGREVVTLAVPGFSPDEARRFLAGQRPPIPDDVVTAVVRRTHDNPMKLALLAEYAQRHPALTPAAIDEIEEIDLFYLVDRVVDRIADRRVQWLLRWGALLPVITRDALEQVLWPALDGFVHTTGLSYDDARGDGLPPSAHDVRRWEIPTGEEIREPGAREAAWVELLGYAARASWVSVVPDLPDTVVLHPEVRAPLRRLLRRRGLPVYDDIHRRSFEHWSAAVDSTEPALRRVAPRALLFHAYQPWNGVPHNGDELFERLLVLRAGDRAVRAGLAREVLELAGESDGAGGPSAVARELAHLELAEAAVAAAGPGGVVAEGVVAGHLGQLTTGLREREPRRAAFLAAVLLEGSGRVDEGWTALDRALSWPAPAVDPEDAHLALMAGWVGARTPTEAALPVVERLGREARETSVRARPPITMGDKDSSITGEQVAAAAVEAALARGLLAVERWDDALDRARRAGSPELEGAALIGLGDADAVLADERFPRLLRARARLLQYNPVLARYELGGRERRKGLPTELRPAELLVSGQAWGLEDRIEEGLDALSRAAGAGDPVVSVEASLELARLYARTGRQETALHQLGRLIGFTDPVVMLRAMLLRARMHLAIDPRTSRSQLDEAEQLAAGAVRLPPSTWVDLSVTRLAVRGVTDDGLRGLGVVLRPLSGAGARLLALRDLTGLRSGRDAVEPDVARLLASLTGDGRGPAAVVLARVELERVLGDPAAAVRRLDRLTDGSDPTPALARAVEEVRDRLAPPSAPAGTDDDDARRAWPIRPGSPAARPDDVTLRPGGPTPPAPPVDDGDRNTDPPAAPSAGASYATTLSVSTEAPGGEIFIERHLPVPGDRRPDRQTLVPAETVASGAYLLAREPVRFVSQLRESLGRHLPRPWWVRSPAGRSLYLHLGTDDAARWPWEAALTDVEDPAEVTLLLRRQRLAPPSQEESPIPSPDLFLAVLKERRDRGQVSGLLRRMYGGHVGLIARSSVTERGIEPGVPAAARILHLVADPVQRYRIPMLSLADGTLSAESLAASVGPEPRLLILDLPLDGSDLDATEQLMIANAFCWQLVRAAPELDVLCGVFGGANDRIGSLTRLVEQLSAGETLATIAGDQQRNPPRLPGGRHPVFDVVSLSTDHPNRRYVLGGRA